MAVKPGCQEEYKKRHQAVWPELLRDLKSAGVRHYSIYLSGSQLFAYMEVEDFDAFRNTMASSEANGRWGAFMAPILEHHADPKTSFPHPLEEVFHLD
jgi:L-rhamnose mutarotase